MLLAELELDLELFSGPFDLLLTLVLRDVVDLLELQLAEVVVSYLDHLETRGELDLEAATEFIVLVAALLELKSRMMLPGEEEELLEFEPGEAAEELLARMLEARRYRGAAAHLEDRLAEQPEVRYREAPLPVQLRRRSLEEAREGIWNPASLGRALGGLLVKPTKLDLRHLGDPRVTVGERVAHLRELLRGAATIDFDAAVGDADRMTVAVTVFALLVLYKHGELSWTQGEPFGEITIRASRPEPAAPAGRSGSAAPAGR